MNEAKTYLGADGVKSAVEAIADQMTYEKTVAMMTGICETLEGDNDLSRINRILWVLRLAYLEGCYHAFELYDEAVTGGERTKKEVILKHSTMTEDEFQENIKQVLKHLMFSDDRLTPSPPFSLECDNPKDDRVGMNAIEEKLEADKMRLEIIEALAGMTDSQLDKAIELMKAGNTTSNGTLTLDVSEDR